MSANPFCEGGLAYAEGLPMSACPYPVDTIGASEWEGGWIEASDEDADED